MIDRLYVHNFRCLENFEFKPGGAGSVLPIGRNGSAKSTVARVLQLFQRIGRGVNRVGKLLLPSEFSQGRSDSPMRFELDVVLDGHRLQYGLALELPAHLEPTVNRPLTELQLEGDLVQAILTGELHA